MRPEALRPATAKDAASATTKLSTRLSKGEKRNRKRLAEVGAVYDADPVVRTPADILARGQDASQDTDPSASVWVPDTLHVSRLTCLIVLPEIDRQLTTGGAEADYQGWRS